MPSSGKENSETVGTRIRAARIAAGLTQAQLAGDDFSPGLISQIEAGRGRPSLATLEIIAARLGMDLAWFVQGDTPDVAPPALPAYRKDVGTLTRGEMALLECYRKGGQEERRLLLSFARWVASKVAEPGA